MVTRSITKPQQSTKVSEIKTLDTIFMQYYNFKFGFSIKFPKVIQSSQSQTDVNTELTVIEDEVAQIAYLLPKKVEKVRYQDLTHSVRVSCEFVEAIFDVIEAAELINK